jgi:hypothetical protein
MRHSTIWCIGLLALGLAALTPPSLAQTDVTAADNTYPGYYPSYPAPGAVIPPYHASPPYIGPGGFITLPSETTGFGVHTFWPNGADMPGEASTSSRKSLIDDE